MNRICKLTLLVAVFVASIPAIAQNDGEEASSRFDEHIHIQVHVVTGDDRPVSQAMHVRLMYERNPAPIVTVSTNAEGVADFNCPRTGNFQIEVSGPGIETTTSDPFPLTRFDRTHIETIRVKLKGAAANAAAPNPSTAGVKELGVPKDAAKEFDAGVASMHASDWQKAQSHFQTAIDKYPTFDQAYDNLGMAKQNAGDTAGAKVAYQKALELNDHNADAQRNMARLMEGEKNWAGAEELLNKSLAVEPNNAGSLTLLSIAQIEQGKVDDAIASAIRVHALEHKSYAVAHLVLARAYEMKSRNGDAIAEYQMYLKEEPTGPRAEAAKKKLQKLTQAAG